MSFDNATSRSSAPSVRASPGLRRRAREGTLTLVYSAHDAEHNDALVLAEVLRRGLPKKNMSRARPHVLIAGGGVAGLETLLALRALAADRVDITILAPELKFVNRSMSAQQPFKAQRARGFRLEDTAAELGARWHRGTLDRVVHAQHRVVIRDRRVARLRHACARPGRASAARVARRGSPHLPRRSRRTQLPVAAPPAARGPGREGGIRQAGRGELAAALYDLALMTAAECAAHDRPEVELSLVTPEEEPLAIFGSRASAAISTILSESGVTPTHAATDDRALQGSLTSPRPPVPGRGSHRHRAAPGRSVAAWHPLGTRWLHPHRRARAGSRPR